MNDKDDQLEQMLRGLSPRRPSALLRARIASELSTAETPVRTPWHRLPWVRAAASFVILLAGLLAYFASPSQDMNTVSQTEVKPPAEIVEPLPKPATQSQSDPVTVESLLAKSDRPGLPTGGMAASPVSLMPSRAEPFRPSNDMGMHKSVQELLRESGLGHDHMMESMERLWRSFPDARIRAPGRVRTDTPSPGFSPVETGPSPAVVFSAGDVTLSVFISDEKGRYLRARDRDGRTIFEGSVNTSEEIERLPTNVATLLEELNHDLELPDPVEQNVPTK